MIAYIKNLFKDKVLGHPATGLLFYFFTEMWELFSFYGNKYRGYKLTVVIGSVIITLGHASMLLETTVSLYLGLALLVIEAGFFKPHITSIISTMYKGKEFKKDGAYTIFCIVSFSEHSNERHPLKNEYIK